MGLVAAALSTPPLPLPPLHDAPPAALRRCPAHSIGILIWYGLPSAREWQHHRREEWQRRCELQWWRGGRPAAARRSKIRNALVRSGGAWTRSLPESIWIQQVQPCICDGGSHG